MNFEYASKSKELQAKLRAFIQEHIVPVEAEYIAFQQNPENLWKRWEGMEKLKKKAKQAGLWNLFLPKDYGDLSPGLTNLEYAPLAEIMGEKIWISEVFNCSAPDTGNMEVLAKYGSEPQKEKWLKPLMNGEIRSAFLMTEPEVASSDATNIETSIVLEGDAYVINGRKWWSSGGMDSHCKFAIVMGKTDFNAPRHQQQSMVIVPMDTEGLRIIRPLSVLGYYDSPEGHAEIQMTNVRVPKENLILGEGRGFEIAQGRLGPGRIHHCMRAVGLAARCYELMIQRSLERETFGKKLFQHGGCQEMIADSKADLESARLLTLSCASAIDSIGPHKARDLIAMIKYAVPNLAIRVIDRAVQVHGGAGVCSDFILARALASMRTLRIADGPDAVHKRTVARIEVNKSYRHSKL